LWGWMGDRWLVDFLRGDRIVLIFGELGDNESN
jgi:hypothetical protein